LRHSLFKRRGGKEEKGGGERSQPVSQELVRKGKRKKEGGDKQPDRRFMFISCQKGWGGKKEKKEGRDRPAEAYLKLLGKKGRGRTVLGRSISDPQGEKGEGKEGRPL